MKNVSSTIPVMNSYIVGILLVTAATVAWSSAGLFTRLIQLDNWTTLLWRGVFGAIAIALISCRLERKKTIIEFFSLGPAGWLFAMVSAVGMVMFISALKHTTVAHVSIVYATVPLVTVGIAWMLLRERPTKDVMVASVAAFVGVGVMVGITSDGHWLGDLLALGMTVCLALMMVITRLAPDIPLLPSAAVSALLSAAMAFPFSQSFTIAADQWLLLFLFGVVNSALGLSLFILGAKLLPAVETALITALDAPLAPILVWLVFSETPSVPTLVGGLIVFIAVANYLRKTSGKSYTDNVED